MTQENTNWLWKPDKVAKSAISRGNKKCDPMREAKAAKKLAKQREEADRLKAVATRRVEVASLVRAVKA